MSDFLMSIQGEGECVKESLGRIKKRQMILLAIIFMLGMRLFFSIFLGHADAWAKMGEYKKGEINLAQADPLNRLGKGFLENKCQKSSHLCQVVFKKEEWPELKKEYHRLLKDYPIEQMLPAIKKLDMLTADFLIAIAKKESNWGKRAPSKNGQDCFNYWGYKGQGEKQVLGYSCFSTREEAIEKVGARIKSLIQKGIDTPEEMLVWKCGSSCAGHDPQGVRKWVVDVEFYLNKLNS